MPIDEAIAARLQLAREQLITALGILDRALQSRALPTDDSLGRLVHAIENGIGPIVESVQGQGVPAHSAQEGSAGAGGGTPEEAEIWEAEQADIAANGPPSHVFDHANYPWSASVAAWAQRLWGVREFRPAQLPAINALLSGHDVLVVMPTGAGKSLVYQLPALLPLLESTSANSDGGDDDDGTANCPLTVVVSPLVALMHDQVQNLHARLRANGLGRLCDSVVALTASTPQAEVSRVYGLIKGNSKGKGSNKSCGASASASPTAPGIALLYVTPERVAQAKRFLSALEAAHARGALARVVVDECHCCSQMGHDFRPDYRKLGVVRALFPVGGTVPVPLVGLSATCGPRVRASVRTILSMHAPVACAAPLTRENLRLSVAPKRAPGAGQDVVAQLVEWVAQPVQGAGRLLGSPLPGQWRQERRGARGIVYVATRRDAETVAKELSKKGIRAAAYHADLHADRRAAVHDAWAGHSGPPGAAAGARAVDVVVATTAFGMGIDVPDVRYVVHLSAPRSPDAYYQECGRAGRDGQPAECLLMYHAADAVAHAANQVADGRGLAGVRAVRAVMRYAALTVGCRTQWLAEYFARDCGDGDDVDGQQLAEVSGLFGDNYATNERMPPSCGCCDLCLRVVVAQDATAAMLRLAHLVHTCPPVPSAGKRKRKAAPDDKGSGGSGGDDNSGQASPSSARSPRWTFRLLIGETSKMRGRSIDLLPVDLTTAPPPAEHLERALTQMLLCGWSGGGAAAGMASPAALPRPLRVRTEFHVTPYNSIAYIVPEVTGPGAIAALPTSVAQARAQGITMNVPQFLLWEKDNTVEEFLRQPRRSLPNEDDGRVVDLVTDDDDDG